MKTRRVMAMLLVAGMLGFSSMSASAAEAWYTCDVNQVGQGWGVLYFQLTDTAGVPAFTEKWALGPTDATQANRALAIALTAVNGAFTAYVKFDASISYPTIKAFYLIAQ